MSNNNAGLTRDALVEKACEVFEHAQRTSDRCTSGTCIACGMTAAADAVLSAVADDLEAQGRVIYKYNIPKAVGIGVAAERVRALLPKETSNE